MDKVMNRLFFRMLNPVVLTFVCISNIAGQIPTRPVADAAPPVEDDSTLYYTILGVLVLGLVCAVGWWYKTKKAVGADEGSARKKEEEDDSVDADAEFAWLRKHTRSANRKRGSKKRLSRGGRRSGRSTRENESHEIELTAEDFKETRNKLNKIKFDRLPINSFEELKPARPFDPLPLSNDDSLMTAIEQSYDEAEEDVEVRELAVNVMAKFKTRNSVEALTEVALYDLASTLRSKAITTLAEFDHESVFEAILLGCADPTREVRAASARALFQLNFDRADAWARIAQSGDQFRIVQAARAAIESDLVERSIDRLVHEDPKYSYEAFTLVALLIIAGETKEIFQALENHRDKSVKMALLKVMKIVRDERVVAQVCEYMEHNSLPEDISKAANEIVKNNEPVAA